VIFSVKQNLSGMKASTANGYRKDHSPAEVFFSAYSVRTETPRDVSFKVEPRVAEACG
jgi:hypothetical protein